MHSLSRSFSPGCFYSLRGSRLHGQALSRRPRSSHCPAVSTSPLSVRTFCLGLSAQNIVLFKQKTQPDPKGKWKLLEEEGISLRGLTGLEGFLLFYKRCFIASKYQEKPPRHLLGRREGLPWTGTPAVSTAQSSDQTLPGLSPQTERLCPLSPVTAGDAGSAGLAPVSVCPACKAR